MTSQAALFMILFPENYNFVGNQGPDEITFDCPEECRPLDHQDWKQC